MTDYAELIARKRVAFTPRGFAPPALHPALKPHQAHATAFAIEQGCSAMFLDTGLGKSFCALEWGRCVVEHTNRPVLMLAPLAVGPQHQREAERWGVDALYIREPSQVTGPRVYITNYERLHLFDAGVFGGVILDESSILKSFTGKTTRALIQSFSASPYRLACTATPAPNDHMELGQHAEFLGVMNSNEMLSRWFISDQTEMGRYRLKKGAVEPFWDWLASWARAIALPSDLGFPDDGYALPLLDMRRHMVDARVTEDTDGGLIRIAETSATSIHREKRKTAAARADCIAQLVGAEPDESWIIWCDTDYEADALTARIADAIEVRGSMRAEEKEARLVAFSTGQARVIVTKPSVAGYGLNWQHCARTAFIGLSYSYESFYQAVRRCWRFGQTRAVDCHIAMADTEAPILAAIERKQGQHDEMKAQMIAAMRRAYQRRGVFDAYEPRHRAPIPAWLREAST